MGELVEGPEAAGQGDQGVRFVDEVLLADGHVRHDALVGEVGVGDAERLRDARDHAGDPATGVQGSAGEHAHQAESPTAVEHMDVVLGQESTGTAAACR
ncbi:hypothetical protein OH779_39965 [Actinacidiphila glaucinigra]